MPGPEGDASHDPTMRLYAEADGMVHLVEKDGQLTFPRIEDAPFTWDREMRMEVEGTPILFCIPNLEEHPTHWTHKDEVPGLPNVDPLVRLAVNATLVREVSGAILHRGDPQANVLLVKSNRGFTKGLWNVPGGFLTYGETPEESVVREVREETNLHIEPQRLLGVYSERFGPTYYMRGFMYLAKLQSGTLDPDPSEIADAKWFPLDEALDLCPNPFGLAAMRKVRDELARDDD